MFYKQNGIFIFKNGQLPYSHIADDIDKCLPSKLGHCSNIFPVCLLQLLYHKISLDYLHRNTANEKRHFCIWDWKYLRNKDPNAIELLIIALTNYDYLEEEKT